MNSTKARVQFRQVTAAALLVGVALLMSACATTPTPTTAMTVEKSAEKTYSYDDLHGMMARLARESADSSTVQSMGNGSTASSGMGSALASNP